MNEKSPAEAGMAAASLAAHKAKEAVAAASRRLEEVNAATTEVRDSATGYAADAQQRMERLQQQARQQASGYIRRNPLRAAGLAFAAGYLIAVLRRP